MQKLLKQSIAVCTAFALVMGTLALPVNLPQAQAAEKKAASKTTKAKKKAAMAKLKLKWSLKKNKKLSITEPYAGIGAKKSQIVIKNYKSRKNLKKKGYTTVSFDVVRTLQWMPTKKQVHKIMDSNYYVDTESVGGGQYVAVVDWETGKSLDVRNADGTARNKYDVTVSASTWKYSKKGKAVTDEDRCHRLALYKQAKIHMAITFPSDCKNVCVGVGGYNKITETKADKAFWNGTGTFGKTSYYKNAKTKGGKKLNSYWMRLK